MSQMPSLMSLCPKRADAKTFAKNNPYIKQLIVQVRQITSMTAIFIHWETAIRLKNNHKAM